MTKTTFAASRDNKEALTPMMKAARVVAGGAPNSADESLKAPMRHRVRSWAEAPAAKINDNKAPRRAGRSIYQSSP